MLSDFDYANFNNSILNFKDLNLWSQCLIYLRLNVLYLNKVKSNLELKVKCLNYDCLGSKILKTRSLIRHSYLEKLIIK